MRRVLVIALLLLCVVTTRRAEAHDVRGEHVFLDIGEHVVAVELRIPLTQLAVARQEPVTSTLPADARTRLPELGEWVRQRVGLSLPDGRAFSCATESVDVALDGEVDSLVTNLHCAAPQGANARNFEFRDDAILERVVTDDVYVFLRRDSRTSNLGESPELLGHLHWQNRVLLVDRSAGSRWTGLGAAFGMGLAHVGGGADHLLFLAMLLLAAPRLARGGRWVGQKPWRGQVVSILAIATAFTVGHTATLALGALGVVAPPVRWVEVLVAASVVVTAIHVLRPLFPGREAVAAGVLGLVHGLAFATALTGLGFDRSALVVTLVGFNLGVEAAQVMVIGVTLPLLALLATTRALPWLRTLGASAALVVGVGWMYARITNSDPVSTPAAVVSIVAGGGAVAAFARRRWLHSERRPPKRAGSRNFRAPSRSGRILRPWP